jgi:hypothetical protein
LDPEAPARPALRLCDHAEYWDEHSTGVIRLLALAHAALLCEPPQRATNIAA